MARDIAGIETDGHRLARSTRAFARARREA